MAICQKSSSKPRAPSPLWTRSCSPTLAPPVRDQQVDAAELVRDRGDGVGAVADDRQHDRVGAGGLDQGGEGVGVGADDAAGSDRVAGQGDLVAGGEDGDARAGGGR